VETRYLQEFVAVAREGSFTGAARGLHLTQSTLSKHIAALEREFSAELFVRERAGIRLTRAGEALYHGAMRMLRQLAQTTQDVRACGTKGTKGEGPCALSCKTPSPFASARIHEGANADVALRRRCAYAAGRFGLSERETGALALYLEDHGFASIQRELNLSRDELADVLANVYRKLKVGDKQQALDLMYSDFENMTAQGAGALR
jgi:DNA-binding CsgD family transcriptional regulator/molybdenum-dependent DNA-binding transcriptional regulator ModE